jgi:hypothetical protein
MHSSYVAFHILMTRKKKIKLSLTINIVELHDILSVKMNHAIFSFVKNEPNEHESEPKER